MRGNHLSIRLFRSVAHVLFTRTRLLIGIGTLAATSMPAVANGILVPVPSVTVRAGDVIVNSAIDYRKLIVNEAAARSYVLAREQVVGKVARRSLPAGAAIPLNAIREPWLFKDGERVAIQFASGGLNIRGAGVALQPGVVGELINVRNIDTGVNVRGIVQPDGSVQVEGNF